MLYIDTEERRYLRPIARHALAARLPARALVRGLVVNKFRGDLALFSNGMQILEEKGDVSGLGMLPYFRNLHLPDEDAVSVEDTSRKPIDFSNRFTQAATATPPKLILFSKPISSVWLCRASLTLRTLAHSKRRRA